MYYVVNVGFYNGNEVFCILFGEVLVIYFQYCIIKIYFQVVIKIFVEGVFEVFCFKFQYCFVQKDGKYKGEDVGEGVGDVQCLGDVEEDVIVCFLFGYFQVLQQGQQYGNVQFIGESY